MLSKKESKLAVIKLGLSEEDATKYVDLIEPQINFHKYLIKKLNISSEEAEKITKDFSRNYIQEELKKLGENISEIERFKIGSRAMKECALANGYDETESNLMETNMFEVIEIFKKLDVK